MTPYSFLYILLYAIALNLDQSKILLFGKELNTEKYIKEQLLLKNKSNHEQNSTCIRKHRNISKGHNS